MPLLTVGHGTSTEQELAARLTRAGAELLVDVRRFPGRRMVADAAVVLHHADVLHLMPYGRLTVHPPTDGVRRDGDRLVYDAHP